MYIYFLSFRLEILSTSTNTTNTTFLQRFDLASQRDHITMAVLPVDLFHLLSEQLARDQEFPTLYNCVVSSKHLSNAGAVAALYRCDFHF